MFQSSLLAIFSFAALATAAPTIVTRSSSEPIISAPFSLILESTNSTLNGSYLVASHAGAAIEQLVVGSKTISQGRSTTFNFNNSQNAVDSSIVNITGVQGQLVWTLNGSNFNLSEPLVFVYNAAYDTAVPEFQPTSNPTTFGFVDNLLKVAQYTDDAKTPVVALDRWYACQYSPAQAGGYSYFALAWKLGSGTPDNASCSKVSVKRVYH